MNASIHHNPAKLCSIRFQYRGQFVHLQNQKHKDRAEAIKTTKARYPGATSLMVTFFVKEAI